MKLLGWMHRKLQQNSIDPFKDFTRGNYCTCLSAQLSIDDDDMQTKPSLGSRYGTNSFNPTKESSFSENEIMKMQEIFEEGTSIINSQLFHGFLAIGTLGSEPMTSEPATPTFPASLENITEKETEVTENDLKLINDELEKFVEAEAEEKEQSNESSCRNSYVSAITLSGKHMEGIHAEDFGKMVVCPLQGYLFGSSIDLPETRSEPKKEKTTLGELFQKTTLTVENSIKESGKQVKPAKQTHKSAKKSITKMLKRLHVSSRSSIPCSRNDATDSIPTKKGLQKILPMFYRKVHPENPIIKGECAKSLEDNKTLHKSYYTNGNLKGFEEAKKRFPHGPKSKEGIQFYNNYKMNQYELSGNNSSGNREHWIRTDEEFLVLEL